MNYTRVRHKIQPIFKDTQIWRFNDIQTLFFQPMDQFVPTPHTLRNSNSGRGYGEKVHPGENNLSRVF